MRSIPSTLVGASRELAALVALPTAVRRFYVRAVASAVVHRDRFALVASARPRELRALLAAADGAEHVVELGTGTAWSAIVMALADADRTVTSFDPWDFPQRDRYLAMVSRGTRARVHLRRQRGEVGTPPGRVDFLFIDIGDHSKELTVAAYRVWRPWLQPRAVVAFHDYGDAWPGVRAAVEELGLRGTVTGVLFVCHVLDT